MTKKPAKQKIARAGKSNNPHSKPFGQSAVREGESRRPDNVDASQRNPGSLEEETLSNDAPYNKTYGINRETDLDRGADQKAEPARSRGQTAGHRQKSK